MKNIVLSAVVAASALFATQASAYSYSSYGSPYYGSIYGSTYGGYYGSAYQPPAGPYINIGSLDAYSGYGYGYSRPQVVASSYRYPSTSYSYPSYNYSSYTPSYSYNSYPTNYGYSSYPYTSNYNYIQPANYRSSTISTVPYSGYTGSYYYNGCRC